MTAPNKPCHEQLLQSPGMSICHRAHACLCANHARRPYATELLQIWWHTAEEEGMIAGNKQAEQRQVKTLTGERCQRRLFCFDEHQVRPPCASAGSCWYA